MKYKLSRMYDFFKGEKGDPGLMGLPGLRGPPGTKVSHSFTSYTTHVYMLGNNLISVIFLVNIFRGCLVTKETRSVQTLLTDHICQKLLL